MDNYQRALLSARELFLKWDVERIIDRCHLRFDAEYLYLDFLGDPWRVERASGRAQQIEAAPVDGNFCQSLAIYDYLCRIDPLPEPSGRFCAVNALPHTAQSSPNARNLHQPYADAFQPHLPALRAALKQLGIAPFPTGDAACMFPVFRGFNAIFQFWEGDGEFPPYLGFLWDERTLGFIKYETAYYVMDCFLNKLAARIAEIEKNVK